MAIKGDIIVFLLFVIVGLYLINIQLAFVKIPELIKQYNGWIIFVGGVLSIFGGINYLKVSKKVAE